MLQAIGSKTPSQSGGHHREPISGGSNLERVMPPSAGHTRT